jgi:hypothetical protein
VTNEQAIAAVLMPEYFESFDNYQGMSGINCLFKLK